MGRAKALAEHYDLLGMDGDLSHLGAEYKSLDTDKVAYVEEFLEDYVIHVLVFARAKVVAAYVDLDTAVGILKLHEGGFAHDATAHDTAGDVHFTCLGVVLEVFFDFLAVSGHWILCCRIGFNTSVAERLHAVAPYDFLFAQFLVCHYTI